MEKPSLKSVKDPRVLAYIEHLESRQIPENNSRVKTYLALRAQVDNWNDQITLGEEMEVPDPVLEGKTIKIRKGQVDLFADKDTKDFDRVFKYLEKADDIEDSLQKMYDKLTSPEKEEVKRVQGSAAEKHIFATQP